MAKMKITRTYYSIHISDTKGVQRNVTKNYKSYEFLFTRKGWCSDDRVLISVVYHKVRTSWGSKYQYSVLYDDYSNGLNLNVSADTVKEAISAMRVNKMKRSDKDFAKVLSVMDGDKGVGPNNEKI